MIAVALRQALLGEKAAVLIGRIRLSAHPLCRGRSVLEKELGLIPAKEHIDFVCKFSMLREFWITIQN